MWCMFACVLCVWCDVCVVCMCVACVVWYVGLCSKSVVYVLYVCIWGVCMCMCGVCGMYMVWCVYGIYVCSMHLCSVSGVKIWCVGISLYVECVYVWWVYVCDVWFSHFEFHGPVKIITSNHVTHNYHYHFIKNILTSKV